MKVYVHESTGAATALTASGVVSLPAESTAELAALVAQHRSDREGAVDTALSSSALEPLLAPRCIVCRIGEPRAGRR